MDYEVQRCTRRCAASGRELAEGEPYFTALFAPGAAVERRDYAPEAWTGPPENVLAWWKAVVPTREAKKARQAPSDILLEMFKGLADRDDQADYRYVLALLLIRRRVLRIEEHETAADGAVALYCPRLDKTYHAKVVLPDDMRAGQIQDELARLLYPDAAEPATTPAAMDAAG